MAKDKHWTSTDYSPKSVAQYIYKNALQPDDYINSLRVELYDLVRLAVSSGESLTKEMKRLKTKRCKYYYYIITDETTHHAKYAK